MNLYFRLLMRLLVSRWQSPICTADCTEAHFRVWPHDIDVYGHMNNGRYLQIMDIARSSWMARCGVIKVMRDNRWGAALGGGSIRFRKALKAFQRYRVTTRLVCWDNRWFYLEHGFIDRSERCVAVGISRAAIRSHGGWVRTADMMAQLDPSAETIPVPEYLKTLGSAEEAMQRAFTQHHADFASQPKSTPGDKTPLQAGKSTTTMSRQGEAA